MARQIIIEHNGDTYYGQVATVSNTFLGMHEHYGIPTANLDVRGEGWGTSFGGYRLDTPMGENGFDSEGTAFGLDHIMQLLKTVGADSWEGCKGKQVIILYDTPHPLGSIAKGLAHISDEDRVFIPSEHSEKWKERDGR